AAKSSSRLAMRTSSEACQRGARPVQTSAPHTPTLIFLIFLRRCRMVHAGGAQAWTGGQPAAPRAPSKTAGRHSANPSSFYPFPLMRRVALGYYSPRAPTDPDLRAVMPPLSHDTALDGSLRKRHHASRNHPRGPRPSRNSISSRPMYSFLSYVLTWT